MTLSDLEKEIEKKLKEIEPRLNTKSRWLWGYKDCLDDLLQKIRKDK